MKQYTWCEMKPREEYDRVTKILFPFSGLASVDPDILNRAADRGTRVHKICEGIMSGLGKFEDGDDVSGFVQSFEHWWNEGQEVIEIEKRFWCDYQQITGQVDMIVDTPEGLAIFDIKTSYKPSKTWPAQGSAYYYLSTKSGLPIKKVYFLHLSRDGSYPKIYEYPAESTFFLDILRVYNHFFK